MKRLVFLLAALLVGSSPFACTSGAPGAKTDPVAGRWLWLVDGDVTVKPNGTAADKTGWHGTWKFLESKERERKYEFNWATPEGRMVIDSLKLSADGKKLEGKNSRGERVAATRVSP